jgi:hypothetical protein
MHGLVLWKGSVRGNTIRLNLSCLRMMNSGWVDYITSALDLKSRDFGK